MVVSLSFVTLYDTTKLSRMKIGPAQTISVDVAEALLANSKPGLNEGSAFIDFSAESPGAINAYAQIVNERESIALSFPFQRESGIGGPLEAVAWAYDWDTDIYISIQNTSKNTIKARPILLAGSRQVILQHVKLKALEATTLKLPRVDWSNEEEFPRSFGLTIEQNNDRGGLVAQGWATNPTRGFSTGFSFSPQATCKCGPGRKHNMYGTGVAIGPSPMMGDAVFEPLLILRNVSADNLSVTPGFSYMAGDVPQKVTLPGLTLAPGESAVRKLRQYQLAGVIPDSVSTGGIHLQYENDTGGLIAEMASVDSTGFYTSQVPLVCGGKNALHMSYWRTDGDWDSILQIENISARQTVAELTISYPGGLYVAERRLKAGELAMISVKQLQQSQTPDRDGNLLPMSASIGGVNIWSKDVNQALIINGMIINSVTGTCGFCGAFGVVQYYGLTDSPQNCFGTPFGEYGVNETVPLQMYMYFDTSQCGSDSIQNLQVSTPSVFQIANSTTLLTVGTGFGQFSAETQGSWSGPDDPNCQSPAPLGASDGFEVFAAVGSIQYQSGSDFVAISGTLYVLKDSTVTFKAIPDPPSGNFRSTPTWSGTSGASGSGVTKAVTFNTVSNSASDFKTVIATSGNSVTVNVIVYDLTGVFTPENNFTGRSLVNFGIEEVVSLSFTATPSATVSQIGGLRWKIVTTGTGNGTLSANDVGTGTYNAPDTAKAIVLAMQVLNGPSKDREKTVNITIVEPSGGTISQSFGTGIKHTNNSWSCGFLGDIHLTPANVSFFNQLFFEGAAPAQSSGWLAGFPPSHPQSAQAVRVESTNTVHTSDEIFTGVKFGPYGVGEWYWDIPWRMITNVSGRNFQFATIRQLSTSDNSGTAIISKGGLSRSRIPSDPTSNY